MKAKIMRYAIEKSPVIAAVSNSKWQEALESPSEVIFYLKANILTIEQRIAEAHYKNKLLLVHIDLCDGIGRDRSGVEFLKKAGVDGIISTRGVLIKAAKELGLITVQRFFALDSQGIENISEQLHSVAPDFMEIMPGVIYKLISKFSASSVPVIAGGLLETKQEVMEALSFGALAVSTGKQELWNI